MFFIGSGSILFARTRKGVTNYGLVTHIDNHCYISCLWFTPTKLESVLLKGGGGVHPLGGGNTGSRYLPVAKLIGKKTFTAILPATTN